MSKESSVAIKIIVANNDNTLDPSREGDGALVTIPNELGKERVQKQEVGIGE